MFDGSFRTNKREINLAGASARSSRTTHINQAKQQRLVRAQVKARLNAIVVLQRRWRGVRVGDYIAALDTSVSTESPIPVLTNAIGCGRKGIALSLKYQFQSSIQDLLQIAVIFHSDSDTNIYHQRNLSKICKVASLLAFRLSPPLVPFFTCGLNAAKEIVAVNSSKEISSDKVDYDAEYFMRKDLVTLGHLIQSFKIITENGSLIVSSISARRIVFTILILLRRSFQRQLHSSDGNTSSNTDRKHDQSENNSLIHLFNYFSERYLVPSKDFLLKWDSDILWNTYVTVIRKSLNDASKDEQPKSTNTIENYYEGGGSMDNLFLCFRDSYFLSYTNDKGGVTSNDQMVVHQILLKWCCHSVLYLATLDEMKNENTQRNVMLQYQQGLSLITSIIFSSNILSGDSPSLVDEQILQCLDKLEHTLIDQGRNDRKEQTALLSSSPATWIPILAHFLSRGMSVLMDSGSFKEKSNQTGNHNIPNLIIPEILPVNERVILYNNPSSISNESTSTAHVEILSPWLRALEDTLSTREHIVLENVLLITSICKKLMHPQEYLLTQATPIILEYALKRQQDLAILASFSARGENIMSWLSISDEKSINTGISIALVNASGTVEEEESEIESDDEQIGVSQHTTLVSNTLQQLSDAQSQSRSRFDNTYEKSVSRSTGKYSRSDLLTMQKLDAIYQSHCLQTRSRILDRLLSIQKLFGNASSKSTKILVELQKFALADKIGQGTLMQQLGESLYSSQFIQTQSTSVFIPPNSRVVRFNEALESYMNCLTAVLHCCSGLKAGRNAASPILVKLAFHDSLLIGMFTFATQNVSLITSSFTSLKYAVHPIKLSSVYGLYAAFCDVFSHNLLAIDDDIFIQQYCGNCSAAEVSSSHHLIAKNLVVDLRNILYDLYWLRPVLASDFSPVNKSSQMPVPMDPESQLRFQRSRLLLSGTKLWNSMYERWSRLSRMVQFCEEDDWCFPQLASLGHHNNNPIIHSQVTALGHLGDEDDMDDSSIASVQMEINEIGTTGTTSLPPANDGGDALASSFRDPKMARVLTCIPQAVPFNRRVDLFNSLLESDKLLTQDESASFRQMAMSLNDIEGETLSGREKVTIHRDSLFDDSVRSLMPLGKKLRKKLQVTFVNKHGIDEAGIDGGGVQKEYFDVLIQDAFLPHTIREVIDKNKSDDLLTQSHPDFFVETPLQTLQVNTELKSLENRRHYEFLGRVLGKTMYESILVEPQFCLPFLNKLLGKQNTVDELKNLDPEYYKNLKALRRMNSNEIDDLGLSFEITEGHKSSPITTELIPGGSNIPVTKENVIQYIHFVSHYLMNVAGAQQTAAFLRGFRDIIPAPWVRLFSAYEFQKLISGDDTVKGIDVHGMMSVMRYSGGFHPSQPIIHWLWEVVEEMTPLQQRKFLKFMTSCSRQPLLGFSSLVPAPCVQQSYLRESDYENSSGTSSLENLRLPTSSTCMNLLKLPNYPNKAILREKLIYAIESAAGFELS